MDVNTNKSGDVDGFGKSWDRPWCTEEMREKRREWSLAGDAGLLKHLISFSENLTTNANQTQDALDSLTNRLNETSIFVDNLTNTTLALANTQFIESRVQEDDVEIEKPAKQIAKTKNDQELCAADVIATVNENIKEGLRIIDEKYDKVDVVASDSDDEGENTLPSIVLRPKDPYQDRPLPYIIGSEKWKASSKIGLESSSSESEQIEEEDEEFSSDTDSKVTDNILNTSNRQKTLRTRLSSTSSESSDYNLDSNSMRGINNGSFRAKSQDTLNLESEPMTPTSVLPKNQNTNNGPLSFAEELAKKLGNVLPSQKTADTQEADSPSINRLKDDLFAPEDDEDVFSNRSENLFSGGGGLFDDDTSTSKWNPTISKTVKTNMIAPSIDIPPPMSSVSTKPKSAFDDLFGDADSEDSDDLFSTKNVKKSSFNKEKFPSAAEITDKKYLASGFAEHIGNIATSTPETHDDLQDPFVNEELNEDDIFSVSKPRNQATSETPGNKSTRKKPIGGISVFGKVDILSSKLSNKIFRQSSSDSSSSETDNYMSNKSYTNNFGDGNAVSNENSTAVNSIVVASNARNSNENLGNSTGNSSGISIQPPSINNTASSSLGVDFLPQMTSTRLKSEDIYRERVDSDSLYAAPSQVSDNINYNSSSNLNQLPENLNDERSLHQDDIFNNEDVFGPPPLSKSYDRSSKSKVISIFDDSDSDDELFFSSKSRSQKSEDISTAKQDRNKSKSSKKISLFDDNDDIFSAKNCLDDKIFAADLNPPLSPIGSEFLFEKTSEVSSNLFGEPANSNFTKIISSKTPLASSLQKPTSLFDDSYEVEDEGLFSSGLSKERSKVVSSIFDEDTNIPIESKSSIPIMGNNSSSSQEKLETDIVDEIKDSSPESFSTRGSRLLDDSVEADDFIGRKALFHQNVEKIMEQSENEVKDSAIFEKSSISSENREPNTESQVLSLEIPLKSDDLSSKKNQVTGIESANDNAVDGSCISKVDPPKTLSIRSISSATTEESSQVPRRAVSGKIKDLMGRMGDLKILSPTDTLPVPRKNEENNDEVEESLEYPRKETNASVNSLPKKESPTPTLTTKKNTEEAISFDEPVQVETLIATSKSRVRIPVKRRPQSRHARQNALRQSGIDFDAVDSFQDFDLNNDGDLKNRDIEHSFGTAVDSNPSSERLMAPQLKMDKADNPRSTEFCLPLTADDRSERSLSKEGTLSSNKNTLLSPSTDEEDLFEMPPDLPEDSLKEDSLFGRAPILSPLDDEETSDQNESSIIEDGNADFEREQSESKLDKNHESVVEKKTRNSNTENVFLQEENTDSPLDPLRNNDLDALSDPSQLFAFVTKTPSPEKSSTLLFNEDDSLFSNTLNQTNENTARSTRTMNLLFNDASEDLFSTSLVKHGNKPLRDSKISLFADDTNDDEDSLFGTMKEENMNKNELQKTKNTGTSKKSSDRPKSIFDSDNDNEEHLFADSTKVKFPKENVSKSKVKSSDLQDIFGDNLSEEEDIFAFKKTIPKKSATEAKSLFDADDDDGDIFGKPTSSVLETVESRVSIKKAITKDLKKTAEQIVEDPLSMLQDD